MTKKTIGAQIAENNAKNIGLEDHVREYSNKMKDEHWRAIQQVVEGALSLDKFNGKDFYIEIREGIHPFLHQPFIFPYPPRLSAPTPELNRHVYKYNRASATIEFLWMLPDYHRYKDIIENKQKYFEDKNYKRMAQFVCLDHSGALLNWVKKENGELPDAIIKLSPIEA